jgi:hypothetical protein
VDKQLTALIPLLFFFGMFILFVAVVIVVKVVQSKRAKERTLQLQSAATMLGWQFAQAAPLNWIPNLEKFPLFNQGHSKSITNLMYGEREGVKAAVFDYEYVIGYGKNRTTHRQSVVYFEPPDLDLPFFSLRPERTFHKIIAAFGYQDIDFGNRPQFSKLYLLRGADEPAVRTAFNDVALSFFEMNQGNCTEGGGNQLFIYRQNLRIAPLEAQSSINWALGIKNLFVRRW